MHDWEAILRRGFESKDLDYKGPCAWTEGDKKACCELVKDIIAIGNTRGGFIVIGVSETATGFVCDGLSSGQCDSFDTSRLNRFMQNYADPPINAHAIKHASQGKNFVIIEIPGFSDTPHICQKDFPGVLSAGALYVRTDNNESAPIKDPSDMRALIEHAVRNRSDQLLSSFRAILTGSILPASGPSDIEQFTNQVHDAAARCNHLIPAAAASLGYRETVFHPARFERLRLTIPDLECMADAAGVTYRGWPYIYYPDQRPDCITHLDDGLEMLLNESGGFQFWRLHQSGCLYLCEMFQEDEHVESRAQNVLGAVTTAYTCAEAVQCLVNLYTGRVADDEAVRLKLQFRGVRGRTFARIVGSTYQTTPYRCGADQIVYEQQRALAEWRAGVISHAYDIFRDVSVKFHATEYSEREVVSIMQRLLGRQL